MIDINGTDIAIDPLTGDLAILEGDLSLISGIDAIRQHLRQRLSLGLGEWFLDINAGVPYLQEILVRNPNISAVEGIFMNTILSTAGVTELNSFTLAFDAPTRTLRVTFDASTINGNLNFSEIIEVI